MSDRDVLLVFLGIVLMFGMRCCVNWAMGV